MPSAKTEPRPDRGRSTRVGIAGVVWGAAGVSGLIAFAIYRLTPKAQQFTHSGGVHVVDLGEIANQVARRTVLEVEFKLMQ